MAKNEMCNSGDSPELSKKLDNSKTPDLEAKIAFLRQCGVDETYLGMLAGTSLETTKQLINVLGDKPTKEEIGVVNACLDTEFTTPKKEYSGLNYFEYTSQRVRGVVMQVANDENYGLAA